MYNYTYHACCALSTDFVQSTYGAVLEQERLEYGVGVWPPRMVIDAYMWWCKNYDTLLGHNPVWYVRTYIRTKGSFLLVDLHVGPGMRRLLG